MNTRTHSPSHQAAADLVDAINARNAHTTHRAESAVHLLIALVMVILGVLALVHYGLPCSIEGALCMAAAIQTRPGLGQRLLRHLRGAYLRYRIAGAKADIAAMQQIIEQARQELDYLPRQIEAHNLWIDHAMLELDSMDLDARAH